MREKSNGKVKVKDKNEKVRKNNKTMRQSNYKHNNKVNKL